MAKEEKQSAEAAPAKKSKKLIIIVALTLVLVLGGGVGGLLWLKNHNAQSEEDEEVVGEKTKSSKKKAGKETPPVYVPVEAFLVNLTPETADSGEQFAQIAISLEVDDVQAGDQIKAFTPKLRNNVMLLLSGKKGVELKSKEGKETLAKEIREQMNAVLAPDNKDKDSPIKDVLFTSFIIQ